MHTHNNHELTNTDHDIRTLSKLLIVVFCFMILELWGHFHSNSLSLLADSVHLFVDFFGFFISLIALKLTKKRPTPKMSFGYSRIEILGALFSVSLIYCATFYLIYESYRKVRSPGIVDSKTFLVISLIGFFVNLTCMYLLHKPHEKEGQHRNLNIRAAYIHVIGDMIQSLGVIIASLVMYINPKLVVVDIICTLIFASIILMSTFYIIRDILYILMEACPQDVKITEIVSELSVITNFVDVVKLHCWNISPNVKAIAVVIKISEIWKYERGMLKAKNILRDKFGFEFVVIQFDTDKTCNFESKEKIVYERGVESIICPSLGS